MAPTGTDLRDRPGTTGSTPVPTRGDRLINFALPDAFGVSRIFYFEVAGGPAVVLAYDTIRRSAAEQALRSLAASAEDLRARGAELFAITADDLAVTRDTAERFGLDFPLFSDQEGAVLPILLAPRPPRFPETSPSPCAVATFVLDPNQRVLGTIDEGPAENHGPGALALLAAEPAADDGCHTLARGAPVLTLPDVFEPALCQRLIESWRQDHQEGGVSDGTRNLRDESKKRNLEHVVLDPDLSRQIKLTLARRIGPELVKVFHFNQPFRFEGFTVLSYRDDRQDFFGVHRDNVRPTRLRRFAVSLNLNDDFEGGALSFPEFGPHLYRPRAGAAVVFSCALLHEALPVTRGQRWVLTTFFCDPERDPSARAPG